MNENYQSRTTIAIVSRKETMSTQPVICPTRMKRPMRLVNPFTGLMRCAVCGSQHMGELQRNGGYHFGAWQCSATGCPTNVGVVRRRPGLR
jgi:hypothetical protein